MRPRRKPKVSTANYTDLNGFGEISCCDRTRGRTERTRALASFNASDFDPVALYRVSLRRSTSAWPDHSEYCRHHRSIVGHLCRSYAETLVGIAPILSLATIMTNFLLVAVPSYWILVVSHSTIVVLIAFFAITILVYVVRSGRITADKTYAAICSLSADRIRLDLCLRPS